MLKNDDKSRVQPSAGQITMSEEEKRFFIDNNNFIDYFLEIGVKPDIFSNNKITSNSNINDINALISPEIISKFPYFDKKSMGIDTSIISFAFPHGFKAEVRTTKPEIIFYSLILDNQFYSSVYPYKFIACLVIYESLNVYKKLYDSYSENNSNSNNSNIPQDRFKYVYIPKCLCLASVHPAINKFEAILRAIYSNIQMGKTYFLDLLIEKLISQTPKIPRGYKKVYLKFSDKTLIDLTERKMNELISVDINLKDLFSIFKIETIIEIFKYILYETKTIFFGSNLNQVTNTILSFMILLKPFTYQYQILSVLPKEYYFLLETDSPWIFGVNEIYFNNFFENNKLEVDNEVMLIVDIDKKEFYLRLGGGYISGKQYPIIPKHLKEKLDKRTEEYRKNKKKEETNEGYQEIFYRFMVNLLKDYPKFLKKNYNGNSRKISDMFDKEAYINAQSNSDTKFYEQIVRTQMFDELVKKRVMPKDLRDKMDALFFEEKLNVKYAQKTLFRGNKYLEQNTLLPSKEYDFVEPKEIIDLSESGLFSKLDINTINFFSKPNINKDECLPRGFNVRESGKKGQFFFDYYIFPTLLSEKLFKYNCKHYTFPSFLFSKKIEEINKSIIRRCFIKFDDYKKNVNNEILNDVYISYLIIFSLTFWYTESEEREYRFNNMLKIMDKIEIHDLEVMELLFNSIIKLGEEEFAVLLHTQYLNMHLNPTSKIFSVISKILKKNQNLYAESTTKSIKSNRSASFHYGNRSMVYNPKLVIDTKLFRTRSMKVSGIDNNILGEQILFDAYGVCPDCRGVVNIEKICTDLTNKEIYKDNSFKCNCKCNNFSLQKLNFRIGTELYNKNICSNNSSSTNQGILLYSPSTLKKKLLDISFKYHDTNFDVEKFRINYPDEFWNAIWYFELKDIDISFMLPYLKQNIIKMKKPSHNSNKIDKFIKFVTLDSQNKSKTDIIKLNTFKNPNNKIVIVENKEKRFISSDLFIQNVFQISIINILGMIMYKSPDEYYENIGFNERILCVTKKENNYNFEEKKNNEKAIKSIMNISSFVTSDFDINNNSSSTIVEKNEEDKLMDENIKNNTENNSINDRDTKRSSSKVHFANDQLFEMMNEEDDNYYILDDYKEDNSNDDSNF